MFPEKHQRKPARGQALLEFALTITILLLLVGGVVDIARMYFAYQVASEAAHEGALYGALRPDEQANITTRVVKSSSITQDAASAGAIDVAITYTGDTCADGANSLEVKVTYRLKLHMPITMAMFGDEIAISAEEKAVILQPACSP